MNGSDHVPCEHQTKEDPEGRRLLIRCKDCEEDFSLSSCLSGLILAFEDEYDIESIIISDYIERKYTGSSIKILAQIRDIAGEIESFSSREEKNKKCENCEWSPSEFFPGLKKRFIEDPGGIYGDLSDSMKRSAQIKDCPNCEKALKEELEIIGEKALRLRRDVLAEGFGIIG
ncbi:MAG: hypothetical protein KGY76_05075 [Candidatus Thermoplasmatota archaeon]|nr:hypothetical protein [Candidatus Thermoplasmatota archaeon]